MTAENSSPERAAAEPAAHSDLHGGDVDGALAAALEALRALGERITAPRVAVLRVLAEEHAHLTAERVGAALPEVHRATVFRTLDKLAALGLVSVSRGEEGAGYHLAVVPDGHAHVHARCQRCGRMEALPLAPFREATRSAAREVPFRVDLGASILVGTCAACAASE